MQVTELYNTDSKLVLIANILVLQVPTYQLCNDFTYSV